MNWKRIRDSAVLVILATEPLAAQAAQGDVGQPLSAIDWLSDSVSLPPIQPPAPVVAPPAAPVPSVSVAPLGAPTPDDAGLIDPSDLSLPADLWGGSSAQDIARQLLAIPEISTPTLRHFLAQLVQARLTPPVDAAVDDSLYLARLDTLLALARLDEAEALINAAGAPEPRRFRRSFDIALLKGTENEACDIIETNPDISPTFPARIFCLARNGEWEVAALTLGTAEALGILTETEDQLLLHFLDPELFEGEELLPRPASISPLLFRLYAAIGERPQTDTLPVAFAVADLSETVGWRVRLRAAERLTAVGALDPEVLLDVIADRRPSASGGLWSRVAAIQAAKSAFDRNSSADINKSLSRAWDAAHSAGYNAALALWFAERLRGVTLDRQTHHTAFEIALLANDTEMARQYANASEDDRTLLAVLTGNVAAMRTDSALTTAIRRSLSGLQPSESYRILMNSDRRGEALLRAITTLSEGAEADPSAIADALAILKSLGLHTLAQRTAAELLLEDSQI